MQQGRTFCVRGLWFVLLTVYYWNGHMQKDKLGGAYGTYTREVKGLRRKS